MQSDGFKEDMRDFGFYKMRLVFRTREGNFSILTSYHLGKVV